MSTKKSNSKNFFAAVENPSVEKIEALQAEGRIVQHRASRDGAFIEGAGWVSLEGADECMPKGYFLTEDGDSVFIEPTSYVRASKAKL